MREGVGEWRVVRKGVGERVRDGWNREVGGWGRWVMGDGDGEGGGFVGAVGGRVRGLVRGEGERGGVRGRR